MLMVTPYAPYPHTVGITRMFEELNNFGRKQNSPENFALLRRLAINLLKQEKTSGTKSKNETVSSRNG